jgi:hypothetical protein
MAAASSEVFVLFGSAARPLQDYTIDLVALA